MRLLRAHPLSLAAAAALVAVACGTAAKLREPSQVAQLANGQRRVPAGATDRQPAIAGARPEVAIEPHASAGVLTLATSSAPGASSARPSTALPERETRALLARLPPPGPAFARRASDTPSVRPPSAPPPPPGPVQPIAFEQPRGRPVAFAVAAPVRSSVVQPLHPPQISPEGDVGAQAEIEIRFHEPMVPVTGVGDVATPPVRSSPAVAGTWRWVDTRVLAFKAEPVRLPLATEFVVTVPAGTRALSGATLAADTRGTFKTAPIAIDRTFPEVALRPDSAVVVQLNQRFERASLLPFLRVIGPRGKPVPFRAVELSEAIASWSKNPHVRLDDGPVELTGTDHIAIAPEPAWPAGTTPRVVLAAGAPSSEGPLRSREVDEASFEVVPPLRLRGVQCAERGRARLAGASCRLGDGLSVEFSTPIADPAARSQRTSKVQIAGQPSAEHAVHSSEVMLATPGTVGKRFEVAVDPDLTDIYGQPLTGPTRASFTVAPPRHEALVEATTGLIVLDPRFAIPQWLVGAYAVPELRVQLFRVQPSDYFAFEAFERMQRRTPPGKLVFDQGYAIGRQAGAKLRVDLRPALGAGGTGHLIALASAGGKQRHAAWIQVTKLSLSARTDRERIHASVQAIDPARLLAPAAGAKVSLIASDQRDPVASAVADASGQLTIDLPVQRKERPRDPEGDYVHEQRALVLVDSGTDSTFAVLRGSYERAIRQQESLWYVTDDRFTYRPGEQVLVKGWVRRTHDGVDPDLALPPEGERIAYSLSDAHGNDVAKGEAALSDHGGFDFAVTLPTEGNLGTAWFTLTSKHGSHRHPIAIQEFRRPAFSVTLNDDVSHAGARPLIVGESVEMGVEAKYYAGGGLPGALLEWDASLESAEYRPPGWSGFEFAPPLPRSYHDEDQSALVRRDATLSAQSTGSLVVGVSALPHGLPSVLSVLATVTDVDQMTIDAKSRYIVVHPSSYYVGLRRASSPDALEAVVTDIDGAAVPGVPIHVEVTGVLASHHGLRDASVFDRQRCELTSAATPVRCALQLQPDVVYTATAQVADRRGRRNVAECELVARRERGRGPVQIVADRSRYRAGDVAKLEIRSTVVPAVALVTVERQGVVARRRVTLPTGKTTVELPIELRYAPGIDLTVELLGAQATPAAKDAPPLATEIASLAPLHVDLDGARLQVRAKPSSPVIEPGAQATFEVEVSRDGEPVADAEVALIVVDEGVLALSRRSHQDPLRDFYPWLTEHGSSGLSTFDLIDDAGPFLAGAPGLERFALEASGIGGSGYGRGAGGFRSRSARVPHIRAGMADVRDDFRANAVFSPRLRTDAQGKATVQVKMPDSLTRFQITALAAAGAHFFGKGESSIVTQRALNARIVGPRFLTQGDAISLPVVVQNLGSTPRDVDVAVRAANLRATGPSGRRVTVPPGERAELRFDFATTGKGRALVQAIASAGDLVDASSVELPVYEPATTEAFATYGIVDDAAQFEALRVPDDIRRDVGGVDVEVASTQLQALTDGYAYLYSYPYECAEQRSGRMLATAALQDVLDAFAASGRPSAGEIAQTLDRDLRALKKAQNPDGGFGYFSAMRSDPYVTIQVFAALLAAKAEGTLVKDARRFVARQAKTLFMQLRASVAAQPGRRPAQDQLVHDVSLLSAALVALSAAPDIAARAANLDHLATALGAYPLDAKARLLTLVAGRPAHASMRQRLLAALLSAVQETAASATVGTTYLASERLLLVSSAKTTALALDALMREASGHALVPKLARGLLEARRGGRWSSTQDNLAALVALRRYFDRYEAVTPSYTGKLWLGERAYAEQSFMGRSFARGRAHLDWEALPAGSTHDVALAKDGAGRMYYRVGIAYSREQRSIAALDAGFVMRRSYRALDHPGDVTREPDGRWRIRRGARVLVTVEAINTATRYAVALVDAVPAGLEAINDELAITQRAVGTGDDTAWDHRNLRDNRSEVFAMELLPGSHHFTYAARATTPGTFAAGPARAEEMYAPETFGRSSSETVVID